MSRWAPIELTDMSILFVDDELVAVDKAAGVLCDASVDPDRDHLGTALRRWTGDDQADFFPAHRLDLATSGVVLFARTKPAATALMQQFQDRTVTKQYQAIVHTPNPAWHVGERIHRRSYLRHRKGISEEVRSGGKPAETDFAILDIGGSVSLVRAYPKTGRTHQLRVHLAALGAPILGDERYGSAPPPDQRHAAAERMWLHADTLEIAHPTSHEQLVIRSRRTFELTNGSTHETDRPSS